jgi:hypothetical protein
MSLVMHLIMTRTGTMDLVAMIRTGTVATTRTGTVALVIILAVHPAWMLLHPVMMETIPS